MATTFNPYEDSQEMQRFYGEDNPYARDAGLALSDANWFNYGKTKRELGAKATDWNAQIQLWNMQNEYNSPAAQAQRMREAGLNPDLQNLSPGEAGSFSMSPLSLGNMPSSMDYILDYGSKIPGVIGSVIGIADKIVDVQGKQIDNRQDRIGFLVQMFDFLANSSKDYPGPDGIFDMIGDLKSNPKLKRYAKLFESVLPIAEGSRYSSQGYKQETESMQNRLENALLKFQEWNRDYRSNVQNQGSTSSQPFADLINGEGGAIQEMAKFYGDLIKLRLEYEKKSQERGISEQDFEQEKYDSASGSLAGTALDSSNQATISERDLKAMDREYTKKAHDKLYQLIDKLSKSSEAGDWLSSLLLMFMQYKGMNQ